MSNLKTTTIKKLITICLALALGTFAQAQEKPKSPAETATGTINGSTITINYGSPSVRGRVIWGELVPFGQVWRAGANEATTFETSKKIMVEGKELPAGKYSFFIIPEKNEATIIFNTESKQWGAYDYNEKKDQLRVKVKPKQAAAKTEKLVYKVNGNNVTMSWDNWDIPISIK